MGAVDVAAVSGEQRCHRVGVGGFGYRAGGEQGVMDGVAVVVLQAGARAGQQQPRADGSIADAGQDRGDDDGHP